jgi:hypothetical protein
MWTVARALGAAVELRYLDVAVDELERRLATRGSRLDPPITRAHLDGWARLFEAPDAAELGLYDPPSPAWPG